MGEGESRVEPLLLIEGLHRSFGSVVVADDLTFALSAGETLGVVGPNGAGKTSMLNLITGSLAPRAGRIRLDGVDITGLPAHRRAALGIARTYQIPRPFETMTVFENVLVGAVHAAGDRLAGDEPIDLAVEALERTDLLRRPNVVAGSLPLLDRKRLELARALATRPRLLLLDEIAGGLTEPEVDQLVGTIRRLKAEGLTILWIEHIVQALLSVVDRLMATSYGRKLAEGDPRVVLADPTVRAVYLGNEPAA